MDVLYHDKKDSERTRRFNWRLANPAASLLLFSRSYRQPSRYGIRDDFTLVIDEGCELPDTDTLFFH